MSSSSSTSTYEFRSRGNVMRNTSSLITAPVPLLHRRRQQAQRNDAMKTILASIMFIGAVCGLWPASADALSIPGSMFFKYQNGVSGGTVSYAGGTSPLVGSNIVIFSIGHFAAFPIQ